VAYAPVFYPGTTSSSNAGTITLTAGEERGNVDIPLVLIPTAKITGRIVSPDGSAPPNVQLALIAHDRIEGVPFSGFMSGGSTSGTFTFTGLAPGTYTITGRVSPRPAVQQRFATPEPVDPSLLELFAYEDVTLSGQDVDVTVTLRRGISVSGRVRFEGEAKPPADLTKISVSLSPVSGGGPSLGVSAATVAANGTFRFSGVTPGRYRVTAAVPGSTDWQLRRAMVAGQDAADVPFEVHAADVADATVVFTDRPAELSGRVQDAAGQAAPDFFIIAFSADRSLWTPRSRRVHGIRPGSDGRFRIQNLAPGDYLIAAVTDVEEGQWFDRTFLEELARSAIKLTIGEGEQKVQDFRVGGR
jgi:hypothetical protein